MYHVNGSVQTFVRKNGVGSQYSSRPVFFVLSEFLPDNSRMSNDGGKTWIQFTSYRMPDAENALTVVKHMLGDTNGWNRDLRVEVTVSVREVAEWPPVVNLPTTTTTTTTDVSWTQRVRLAIRKLRAG